MDRVSVHCFHLELPGRQVLLTFDERMHISTPHTWNYLFFFYLTAKKGSISYVNHLFFLLFLRPTTPVWRLSSFFFFFPQYQTPLTPVSCCARRLFNVSGSLFVALLTPPTGTALVRDQKRCPQSQIALTPFTLKANPPRNQRETAGPSSPAGVGVAGVTECCLSLNRMFNTDWVQSMDGNRSCRTEDNPMNRPYSQCTHEGPEELIPPEI